MYVNPVALLILSFDFILVRIFCHAFKNYMFMWVDCFSRCNARACFLVYIINQSVALGRPSWLFCKKAPQFPGNQPAIPVLLQKQPYKNFNSVHSPFLPLIHSAPAATPIPSCAGARPAVAGDHKQRPLHLSARHHPPRPRLSVRTNGVAAGGHGHHA
ncbi:unnamed protein product [Triticum turgidum subsp. durum]|uniref:Uncharacterized protein n=1 Tax=Triticum turgidum subsp. durum TaxID=4567 RepID=A0A9R1PWC4_TRITD|nr:unnamed protein product [Triticum turgidum subsp. durum]